MYQQSFYSIAQSKLFVYTFNTFLIILDAVYWMLVQDKANNKHIFGLQFEDEASSGTMFSSVSAQNKY